MDEEASAKSLDDPRATRSERITPEANAFESPTQSDIETAVVPVEVPVVDLQNKESLLSKHKCNENGVPQFMFDAISSIALQLGFTPGLFQIKFDKGHDKPFDITWIIAEPWKATITEDDQTHILFCKVRPINEVTQKNVHTRKIFDREVDAYVKFLPTIYEFQRVKGITQDVGFFNAPRCYLAFNDKLENAAMIIMEDLHLNGYRTWNKQNPFDYDHARLLMVQLGRLHAVSLALKEQRPEVFEQFKILGTSVTDLKGNPSLLEMMRHELDRALATLEPHENRLRLKLLNLCSTLEDDLITITSPEFSEPYSVFGHGDCRANDPMFFYEVSEK
ncbi:uncharacterized protein LOC134220381 [Armigeres subalbatus]|uniref:uncharacterized protein LOC134220381 n=1 Tax=Armigeres subalbatus TaxID=124917 RepID=UPI002ED3C8DB